MRHECKRVLVPNGADQSNDITSDESYEDLEAVFISLFGHVLEKA